MEIVSPPTSDSGPFYYIPHHFVLKPESTTTKLRVVFDGSCCDSNGRSLNSSLITGPKLQRDLASLLINFRFHKYVFTADIKQMYRQILVHPSDRDYQRILWRFSSDEPISDFALKTVTFGVSSSPFLALRTIQQLSIEGRSQFPLASRILELDIFVDDIVTGSSSLESAKRLQLELIELCKSGGFDLRKWASNSEELLSHLDQDHCQDLFSNFDFERDNIIKILGLQWLPLKDVFSYRVAVLNKPCTKRNILSDLARIFDPLGFLAPLTFFAKHLIQYLWSLGLDWDETPSSNILIIWNQYKLELEHLSKLEIPRHIVGNTSASYELHAFCDASERGYCAVVYLRSLLDSSNFSVAFVCAKSKVSPLKRISLPRLELCGAVLLANLVSFILVTFDDKIPITNLFGWSDSMVVLSWLKSSPHRWKSFVANRVSHIQNIVPPTCWHYVKSAHNPADCGSRGLLPTELIGHTSWWAGPSWLALPNNRWPSFQSEFDDSENPSLLEEEERHISLTTFVSLQQLDILLDRFSSLAKIQRIVSYVLRFIHNLKNPQNRKFSSFTQHDLHCALLVLVKKVQHETFLEDMLSLRANKRVSKSLRKLAPFIDEDGIFRVGGRLANSNLTFSQKHPALLPRFHRLTYLIVEQYHQRYMHVGLQTLQFLLSQSFWILSFRRAIRHVLSKCIKCFRINPRSQPPLMADLPSARVNQIKPFQTVGVDYAGPFFITLGKHRGIKSQKAYLCLFVCFATKALHLELASDLSTECFLGALRRFIARRGRCNLIFSDQGTNFVGAKVELDRYMKEACVGDQIKWSLNPPASPHFGGLWEAGVKSVKSHLRRVIGEQILSYEELYTVLTQVEAILNSRPLCPLSSDPNDLSVLSPGHFLTLAPLSCVPEPDLSVLNINRLTRWQLLQKIQQDFWRRWHVEYLHTTSVYQMD